MLSGGKWKAHKTNIYSIILGMLACKSEQICLHLKRLQSVEIILFRLLGAVRLERRLCVRVNFIIDACTKRELLKHFGQLFRFTAMQWVRRVIQVL